MNILLTGRSIIAAAMLLIGSNGISKEVNTSLQVLVSQVTKRAAHKEAKNSLNFTQNAEQVTHALDEYLKLIKTVDDNTFKASANKNEKIIEDITTVLALIEFGKKRDVFSDEEMSYVDNVIFSCIATKEIIRLRGNPLVWEAYKDITFPSAVEFGKYLVNEEQKNSTLGEKVKEYECLFST